MKTHPSQLRTDSVLTGVFFISAAVFSIAGLILYDPVLKADPARIPTGAIFSSVMTGVIFELILAVSAAGTAVMMYPYLKRYHESLGLAYISFRLLEVVFILIGLTGVLVLLSLGQIQQLGMQSETAGVAAAFLSLKTWTFILGPNFMLGINTGVYSFGFLKSGLVPQKLAVFGLLAAGLILVAALLELYGIIEQISPAGILLAVPIAGYEMTLAGYLILRGFRPGAEEKKSLPAL